MTAAIVAAVLLPFTVEMPGMSVYCAALMVQSPQEPQQEPQQQEPQQQPCDPEIESCYTGPQNGHVKPTMACTPHNRPDGKLPCMCLKQHPEGCKKGKRETETNTCNSWCWKELCKCCSS